MSEYKLCPSCGQTFPATTEFFPPFKRNTSTGLYTYCRECSRKRDREYKNKHREEIRVRDREAKRANPDKAHAIFKRWYDKNRKSQRVPQTAEEKRENKQLWRKRNPEKVKEQKRKSWHKHSKQINARNRNKWLANRAEINARNRRKYAEDPTKRLQYSHRRRAQRRGLPHTFNDKEARAALEYWHWKCAYCGISLLQLSMFDDIQTHFDHYIALTDPRPDNPGTVATNMLPTCRSCNDSKNKYNATKWLTCRFGKSQAHVIISLIQGYFYHVS